MNAHKFVAEHGIERAKAVLDGAPIGATHIGSESYFKENEDTGVWFIWSDGYWRSDFRWPEVTPIRGYELKQVVESVELINCFDDLDQAKSWVPEMDNDYPYVFKGDTYDNRFYRHELEQAIADYEVVEAHKGGDR